MNLREAVILCYQELYRQATLRYKEFEVRLMSSDEKLLDKFVLWMEGKYGKDLDAGTLTRYFEFQFSRYSGTKNNKYGKNSIMLSWLIGPRAIQAWEDRNVRSSKHLFRARKDFTLKLKKLFVSVTEQERKEAKLQVFREVSAPEEQSRAKFLNKPEGFFYCQVTTTMYHPLSRTCELCNFKEDCKRIVKENLPVIAESRGYL